MKIVDFLKKGNVVRFYLANDDVADWCGDDWDDTPYEHNAGAVYDKYIAGHIDVAFDYDCQVAEPKDDWRYNGNTPYCKDDFVARKAPCVVIYKPSEDEYWWDCEYSQLIGIDGATRIYFGDDAESLSKINGATIISKA